MNEILRIVAISLGVMIPIIFIWLSLGHKAMVGRYNFWKNPVLPSKEEKEE